MSSRTPSLVSAECRLAIRRYECWLESKIVDCNDIGAFYRFVNSKSSCRSGVGTLIGPDGKTATCDKKGGLTEQLFRFCLYC